MHVCIELLHDAKLSHQLKVLPGIICSSEELFINLEECECERLLHNLKVLLQLRVSSQTHMSVKKHLGTFIFVGVHHKQPVGETVDGTYYLLP